MDVIEQNLNAGHVAKVIKALSSPSRLVIYRYLYNNKIATYKMLEEKLDSSPSEVFRHVSILVAAKLIEKKRENDHVVLSLNDNSTQLLLDISNNFSQMFSKEQ